MMMQHKLTYGDSLSPIRANFQNIPKKLLVVSQAASVGEGEGGIHVLVFPRIDHPGDSLANVGTCADEQEDDEEQCVEMEEGGLGRRGEVNYGLSCLVCLHEQREDGWTHHGVGVGIAVL